MSNLEELDISISLEEIKNLSKYKFKNILSEKIEIAAFRYLVKRRGFKGSNIEDKSLKMAEYLSPLSTGISIEDRRKLFVIRNNMIDIPSNMKSRNENVKCLCGEKESQKHILECKLLNDVDPSVEYEKVFNGNLREQIEVMRIIDENMKKYQLLFM